jgi:hypothetical protein
MYVDLDSHNDAAKLEMAQADRKAAAGWRYRHHRGAASRVLSAAWSGVKGIVDKALSAKRPGIAIARKRLSY